MDLSKSREFFEPNNHRERIHIIGCGSVGSTVAELLARFGLTKFTLYDFDIVEPHNIVNQMFRKTDVAKLKVDALKEIICEINPDAEADIKLQPEGWNGQPLSGIVILAVDNIELRKKICQANKYNANIAAMFDFRTALFDAQHYGADWSKVEHRNDFMATMDFTHDEVTETVSACGVTLGVAPTVRMICTVGVTNIVNFMKQGTLHKVIIANPWIYDILAMGN